MNRVLETSPCSCALPAPTRYRCDVIGRTALDVVSGMGGRLADLAMAGWEVTAALADYSDTRPLRIVGAAVVDLDWLLAGLDRHRIPHLLTVAGDVCRSDERVRRGVQNAVDESRIEVAVWGRDGSVGLDAAVGPLLSPARHLISGAGRAFKASALAAVGRPAVFEPSESYWTIGPATSHIHTCI